MIAAFPYGSNSVFRSEPFGFELSGLGQSGDGDDIVPQLDAVLFPSSTPFCAIAWPDGTTADARMIPIRIATLASIDR